MKVKRKAVIAIFIIMIMVLHNKFIPAYSVRAEEDTTDAVATEESSGEGNDADIPLSETESYNLVLEYDDRYSLGSFKDADLTGYAIYNITTETVTSYQVSEGKKLSDYDASVVVADSTTGLRATGIGTATVTLYNSNTDKKIILNVTVKPAVLTMIFIAGQSNGEGSSTASDGFHPENSIVCREGEVYSTYAPSSTGHAIKNTGISSFTGCTKDNAGGYVAGSLTGDTSISGKKLVYPLNSLTVNGGGMVGMDSGLGYQWNRLTGDKTWVINAGWSGTSITRWIPGGDCYERAVTVYQYALETAQLEIDAGHYTRGKVLLFWVQGEADKNMSADDYTSYFKKMYNGFEGGNLDIDKYGIITIRAFKQDVTKDLYMTGPRIAQYMIGESSSYPDVYVVSNANEQWTTDSGVKSYFSKKYGSSLTYPLRKNATISGIPTTVAEVHDGFHYVQAGYNENGLTAAETMYHIIYGGGSTSTSVSWRGEDGSVVSSGTKLSMITHEQYVCVPVADSLVMQKKINISVSGTGYVYNKSSCVLNIGKDTGSITAKINNSGSTLYVSAITSLSQPAIYTPVNTSDGIKVSWAKSAGASGYYVFRRTSGGDWKWVGTTTGANSLSYIDKTAQAGTVYAYTVRAYYKSSSGKYYYSSYNTTGIGVIRLTEPSLYQPVNTAEGVKVSWAKSAGASGYYVFRRTSGESWKCVGTTTGANSLSYVDKTAQKGTIYAYTVRAYYKSSSGKYYYSSYNATGRGVIRLTEPSLYQPVNTAEGVKVSWAKSAGASGYYVFRRTSGGDWKWVGTTTGANSLSFVDKTAQKGTVYAYTVRAYYKNSSGKYYYSSYNATGRGVKCEK